MKEFDNSYQQVITFSRNTLKLDTDYGVIQGTEKKTLYKAGAEKLAYLFGLKPELELIKAVEDFDTGFFFYRYKCKLVHFQTGKFAGEAVRSCNSMEKKYAFSTVSEKFATEEQKKNVVERFTSQKGYTMLKVRKTPYELADITNTIDAMAQKRAIVASVVQATMATEIFDISEDEGLQDGDFEAPHVPTNKETDPRRTTLTRKYYATASERGLDGDNANKLAEKRFKVSSFKDLTNEQIIQATDGLITQLEVVGKGNKPRMINKSVPKTKEAEVVEGEVLSEAIDTFTGDLGLMRGSDITKEVKEVACSTEGCKNPVPDYVAKKSEKIYGRVLCTTCYFKEGEKEND